MEYLGRTMSKWEGNIKIDLKFVWRVCTGLRQKQVACSCDCVNELSGSVQCGEILG